VLTSGKHLATLGFDPDLARLRVVDLDEIGERSASPLTTMMSRLAPLDLAARWTLRGDTRNVDAVATVLFSYPPDAPTSPRGAVLTHYNLLSNLEALRQVFDVTPDDRVLALLPLSNAMSFATTLWLPVLSGARVVFGAGLANGRLGELIARERITLLAVTPQLLALLTERVAPAQLSSLRFAAVGGEDLPDDVAAAFAEKFGIEPLEGYGRPECAPIVSLNVPDIGRGKERQLGSRAGTTGHPLPGISVRVVDPATGRAAPPGTDGILWVRGPNVMKGYVEGPLDGVFRDGWYVTGDHARLDEDGFLTVYYPHSAVAAAPAPR
jgi:acyl-[acyl-carrier-protein]-phospholipid O-acyltransferase/long-chain-fatty-acid--[acyl-carrier-protein] ligase